MRVEPWKFAIVGLLLATACRPGEARTGPPTPGDVLAGLPEGAAPTVRVGVVVRADSIVVRGPGDITASTDAGAYFTATERWVLRAGPGGGVIASSPGKRDMVSRGPMRVRGTTEQPVRIDSLRYRGEVLVRSDGRTVTAVNVVDIEQYLLGVVPHEIGRRPPNEIEAVKAQAVSARTYAIGNLGGREREGFDFYGTVLDQVYRGVGDEDSVSSRAVRETRGEIITYQGRPILAYYSSTCGGRTAAIEESWPWRAPLPYLKSVSDRIPGTDTDYCATSNRYRWSTQWTRAQLLAVLGQSLRDVMTEVPDSIADVEIRSQSESGRTTLTVETELRDIVLRADSLRWILRTSPGGPILNSSRIESVIVDTAGGHLEHLEIRGGGWGHGIGMCQVGALGRARAGQRYDEILRTYYTNTEIQKLY